MRTPPSPAWSPHAPPLPALACTPVQDSEADSDTGGDEDKERGCASAPAPGSGLLLGLLLIAGRRRRAA